MDYLLLIPSSVLLYWIFKKLWKRLPSWTRLFHLGGHQGPVPEGSVILHQVGRGMYCPSNSPFPLKLETYLRMARIPYVNDHSAQLSSKNKTPWMEHEGEAVADSQFCIEHLNKKLNIDLNSHLTAKQRAAGRALIKMTEEHLYWSMAHSSFSGDLATLRRIFPFNSVAFFVFSRYLRYVVCKQLWSQGMGRHTLAEGNHAGMLDLTAISDYLGEDDFIMGSEPCEYDCAIFGMLCGVFYNMEGSPHHQFVLDHQNLKDYVQRVKTRYWPDWDECILSSPSYDSTK